MDLPIHWYVAHTRPRCEKKLCGYCQRHGVATTLPSRKSVKKYRGKTLVFDLPLFPGYVFLQMTVNECQTIRQSAYVANLLEVIDQALFHQQLHDILLALDSGVEILLAPTIQPGTRVMIKSGPLRGLEGWVQERVGLVEVQLRLDFIAQAAAVKVNAAELELV